MKYACSLMFSNVLPDIHAHRTTACTVADCSPGWSGLTVWIYFHPWHMYLDSYDRKDIEEHLQVSWLEFRPHCLVCVYYVVHFILVSMVTGGIYHTIYTPGCLFPSGLCWPDVKTRPKFNWASVKTTWVYWQQFWDVAKVFFTEQTHSTNCF